MASLRGPSILLVLKGVHGDQGPIPRTERDDGNRSDGPMGRVGWSTAGHPRTERLLNALERAVRSRRPESGDPPHSDPGCQSPSLASGRRYRETGVDPSKGSAGDGFDNAVAESFFATLECELINRRHFPNHGQAKQALFAFIEGWYNPSRRHSALDYRSPKAHEQAWREAV